MTSGSVAIAQLDLPTLVVMEMRRPTNILIKKIKVSETDNIVLVLEQSKTARRNLQAC